MSPAQSTEKHTSTEQVCRFLEELDKSKRRYAETSVQQRISLAEKCAEGVAKVAPEWVDLACSSQGDTSG